MSGLRSNATKRNLMFVQTRWSRGDAGAETTAAERDILGVSLEESGSAEETNEESNPGTKRLFFCWWSPPACDL